VPLRGAQPVPQAHGQDDHQRGPAATQAARQEHLQLGGDGAAEGHGGARPAVRPAHLQEHHGLHPLRGGGGEQGAGQEPADPPGREDHQAQWLHRHPEGVHAGEQIYEIWKYRTILLRLSV